MSMKMKGFALLRTFAFVALVPVFLLGLVACDPDADNGGDVDEEETLTDTPTENPTVPQTPSTPSRTKMPAEFVVSTSEYTETYVLSYDDKGRLTEVASMFKSDEDKDENIGDIQLVWGDGAVKVVESSGNYTTNYTVTFEGGIAQRTDVSTGSYRNHCVMTYDQSKRFVKGEEKDGYEVTAIWDGDKLMSISEDGYDTTFIYGETCKKGYFPFFSMWMDIIECDILCMAHPELFGMKTTQLPSSWTISSRGDDDIRTATYELDKDGYLSKMDIEYEGGEVTTITLTWK